MPDELLAHTSPLTWKHMGFSGEFLWDRAAATAELHRPLSQGRDLPSRPQAVTATPPHGPWRRTIHLARA